MLKSVQWKCRILPNIINNLNFLKNGFKKKSALGGFGLEGFWIAHTIYLMDFGVPKMGFLVLVLGVIERGVNDNSTDDDDDGHNGDNHLNDVNN